MRSDAARNRALLLEVAARRFTDGGLDVPLEEVAAEAGVGIATLYRHFASREALVLALLEDKLEPVAAYAREQADRAEAGADPVRALADVLWFSGERHTRDRALCQLWRTVDADVITEAARTNGLVEATERLLAHGRAAGGVRDDVDALDVARAVYAVAGVVEAGHAAAWERFMRIHLRGMLTDPSAV